MKISRGILIFVLLISIVGCKSQLKKERNSDLVKNKLSAITTAAKNGDNLIPLIIDAAKSYCTLGEIVDSMKVVFGEWKETSVI